MSVQTISPDTDQVTDDTQITAVGSGDPFTGTSHCGSDTQRSLAGSGTSSAPAATNTATPPMVDTSRRDADLLLYLYADQLEDVEHLRIATENRIRTLLSPDDWGKAVNPDMPEVQVVQSQAEQLQALEHGITLALKRSMRAHYLGPWCKATVGVGEKQLGRLLAVIGDPATRDKPSQLWAYCGLHVWDNPASQQALDTQSSPAGGVAPSLTRGRKANWNTSAKTRTYLVAEACIKAGVRKTAAVDDSDGYDHANRNAITAYGRKYLDGRAKYAESVHNHPCPQCGPAGTPAKPGSDLSDGHKHARAMRLLMKQILLDLWKTSKETPA